MVMVANPAGNQNVLNGSLPCEGTKAFPFNLDFTAANAYQIDLAPQYNQGQFQTLQTAYIDNIDNPEVLEIIISGGTYQRVVAPAFSQGFYAILVGGPPPVIMVQTSGTLLLNVILLNFYIPPVVWYGELTVDIPAIDAIIVNGGLNVNSTPPTFTGFIDASGTITAGGVAQALFALSAGRKRFVISNPSSESEALQFNFNGGGFIDLLPGMTWDESGSEINGDAVTVKAATTGHAFTAYSK